MGDTYEQITETNFLEHFEGRGGSTAYITQKEIGKKFRKTVDACVINMGELFVSEVTIITEKLSPLAIKAVRNIARKHGYKAECKNCTRQLRYLYSDGWGHYSTDYYHHLEYGLIRVTLI